MRTLDPESPLPSYKQVAAAIRDAIPGEIPLGSPLPSRAELIEHFQVSHATISNAYRILREDGHIQWQRGGPVFARSPMAEPVNLHETVADLVRRVDQLETWARTYPR